MTKGLHSVQDQIVSTTSYAASGAAVFLGLNVDEWGIVAAVAGVIGIIATFAFNVWFKLKHGKRG